MSKTKTKRKKKNPRRIPMKKSDFSSSEILAKESRHYLRQCWVILFSALLECCDNAKTKITREDLIQLWSGINALSSTTEKADKLVKQLDKNNQFNFKLPYPHLSIVHIKSEFDVRAYRRKVRRNAVYAGLGLLCESLAVLDGYTFDIAKVYLCANLIEAEVYADLTNLDALNQVLMERYNLSVEDEDGHCVFIDTAA